MKRPSAFRRLGGDVRGLSTVEYVILLVAIGAMIIGAWRQFGRKSSGRADEASGRVAGLEQNPRGSGGGGGSGGGSGGAVPEGHRPSLEDGAASEPEAPPEDSPFQRPVVFLTLAAILVLALIGKNFSGRKLDAGGGEGGGATGDT